MPDESADANYGTSRATAVSYLEVEQASIALLKEGVRPSIAAVRKRLGRGSPQTLLSALKRFWRDLGTRVESDPAALTRLPAEIAGAVDTLWQRALALAADAARQREGANLERLEFLKRENELKGHTISLRERELDTQTRMREQRIEELESTLRQAMTFIAQQKATIQALNGQVHRGQVTAAAKNRRSRTLSVRVRALDAKAPVNRKRGVLAKGRSRRKRRG